MSKGSQLERDVCRTLSLWFSGGTDDDYFWRTSQSGGRATIRSRSGMRTENQYGDIAAVRPEGFPLTKVFCIEVKRGYTKKRKRSKTGRKPKEIRGIGWNPLALLCRKCSAHHPLIEHVAQAKAQAKLAGTPHWLLIFKPDGADVFAVLSHAAYKAYTPYDTPVPPLIWMKEWRILRLDCMTVALSAKMIRAAGA